MSQQVNVNIHINRELEEHADVLFNRKPYDNYKAKIELSMLQADEGKLIEFTMEELESLENMETDSALKFIELRRKEMSR